LRTEAPGVASFLQESQVESQVETTDDGEKQNLKREKSKEDAGTGKTGEEESEEVKSERREKVKMGHFRRQFEEDRKRFGEHFGTLQLKMNANTVQKT
jgi:hypothetical protein